MIRSTKETLEKESLPLACYRRPARRTSQALTALQRDVGVRVLQTGGNAIDAAVAIAYAREADANLEVRFTAKAGRRIVGVCDRPIGFLEAYYSGRSLDNKFGIVIIDLKQDKNEKEQGVGQLIYAAKVTVLEGNKVEIENLGIDPVKLLGVGKF